LVLTDDKARERQTGTHLCGCFMYMTPKILSAKCNFFEKWIKETRETFAGNEQNALNSVLAKETCGEDVPYDVLPRPHYAPGPRTDWHRAHIVHANYVNGIQAKIHFLKQHHLWHESTAMWLSKTNA